MDVSWAKSTTIKSLVTFLKKAADSYYNTGEPIISDELYDEFIDILKERSPNNPFLKTVGSSSKKNKVKLPYWLGSMNKIKDKNSLNNWLIKETSESYILSDKLDGISAFYYNNKLYTRGNGSIGQDISFLIPKLNLPTIEENIGIRGEIISKTYNRNQVSGFVNSKYKDIEDNVLDFVAYEIVFPIKEQISLKEQLDKLKYYKFKIVYYILINTVNFNFMVEYLKKRKKECEYTIDGIIITKNTNYIRNIDGNPEYSIAFKQNVDIYQTKVINIDWNISKDGKLIPRVQFEPIQHDNITMTFATGFNAKFILDNNLGPDSIIEVVRSGDVIPYINSVIKSTEPQFPKIKYIWDKNHVHIQISSNKEELTLVKRITNFVKTVEIKYIDEKIISKIVELGLKTINDFLRLTKEDLLKVDGISEILADKIITQMKTKLKDIELSTLMVASNIFGHGLGIKKAKKFVLHFPNFLKDIPSINDISEIDGFKDKTAELINKNIKTFKNWLEETKLTYSHKKNIIKNKKQTLEGMKIVFSGFRDKELENKITELGGEVVNTISKNTNILIVKDINDTSSKIIKAKELGIKIIKLENFNLV